MSKKSNKKPELSNKPVEKDPPKSSFLKKIFMLACVGVLIFAGVTTKMFMDKNDGKWPWEWDEEQRKEYANFAADTAKDAANKVKKKAEEVDWKKWKDLSERLWNKLSKMENEIEARLKKEEARQQEVAEKSPQAKNGQPVTTEKSSYALALESMREATQYYRKAKNDTKAIRKARTKFEEAQVLFRKALKECPDEQKPEVESMLQECNQYVYDCIKRDKA